PMRQASVMTTCFTLTAAAVTAASGQSLSYNYLGEHIPLGVDATRIAVFAPEGQADTDLRALLTRHGIDPATRIVNGVKGWQTYEIPADRREVDQASFLAMEIGADGVFASPVFIDQRHQPLIMTRDLLIGFKAGVTPEKAREILAAHVPGEVLDVDFGGLANVYRFRTALTHGLDVLEVGNELADLPEVDFAESDFIVKGVSFLTPNDPLYGGLWGLNQANDQDMDAPEAWDITTGDSSVQVVVLDVGMQQNHPDLNQVTGMDFSGSIPGGGPANECDNHGTAVAGCVAAIINNNLGVVGVAPDCIVKSGKIGTSTSFFGLCLGTFDSQPSMLVNALNWSVTSGARVTNSSFGYTNSAAVNSAYASARTNGVIHFVATGNDGSSTISYPANLPSVNAIGAMAASGNRATFSQYGVGIDLSAPGQGINSTDRTGADGYEAGDYVSALDGTSFASPYAAGVAALVISANPSLTVDEVEQILYSTAVDKGVAGYDTTFGWGFINAYNAVLAAAPPSCPGDATGDMMVDFDDLNEVLINWGTAGPDGDLDGSNSVDFDDLNLVLSNWGNAC
ncbi:MAG: S8 family serine peptidase, partial [Phycisphaerales bacterium]|nr:S8 family serine peptidase [Phycisphaerales bacterium]